MAPLISATLVSGKAQPAKASSSPPFAGMNLSPGNKSMESPVLELRKKTGLTMADIANEIGTSERNIARWSKLGGFPIHDTVSRRKLLAYLTAHGVDYEPYMRLLHAHRNRKGLANLEDAGPQLIKPRGKSNMIAARERWSSVDWSRRNSDIARELQLSPERIRQVRKQHAPAKYACQPRVIPVCAATFSGHNLKRLREKNLLTQAALAERVCCKKLDLIRQWENGERTPAGDFMLRLQIVLNASPSDFIDEE